MNVKKLLSHTWCFLYYVKFSQKKKEKLSYEITPPAIACSKLTIKIPERRQMCRSGVFIVSFEQVNANYVYVPCPIFIVNFLNSVQRKSSSKVNFKQKITQK